MASANDGVLDVPIFVNGDVKVNENDYGLLKMAALNGTQRQSDGAGHYAENLRYDYLEGKSNLSMTEGLGVRYVQGPHPQYGSPDAPRTTT